MQDNKMLAIVGVVVLLAIGGIFFLTQNSDDAELSNNSSDQSLTTPTTPTTTATNETDEPNIVEIAVGNPDFSTLVTALQTAGLVEALQGTGPFTVFAPTNEAFDALPEGTLEAVLADVDQLTAILSYHVVAGRVLAEDVVTLTSATTLQGQTVNISVVDGNVFINDAQVVITDIAASNGVIHVIDAVLLPETE